MNKIQSGKKNFKWYNIRSYLRSCQINFCETFSNRPFISRLPDKGKRIRELAERLRSILALRAEVDGTADMLEKMAIEADYKHMFVYS